MHFNNTLSKFRLNVIWLSLVLFCISIYSCRKNDSFNTSSSDIAFSADTLMFDTVFTSQGSSTRSIKVYNRASDRIKIQSIGLKKGDNSPFYLNVDGQAGKIATDLPIEGKDSLYVFAGVNIDPNADDAPFIVEDSLVVIANGTTHYLPIIAFGQNAIYIVDSVLNTQTWDSPKPYVILHNAQVASSNTLTIPAGTRIYMHADSRLYVDGTLKVNGTKTDSVVFQGDRLDRLVFAGDYIDIPGEWGGLYFSENSHDNVINYMILKNAGASTTLGTSTLLPASIQLNEDADFSGTPMLTLTNSKIYDSYGYGILAFNSSLKMQNCLVHTCGQENLALIQGGNYFLYDNTIVNYGYTYLPSDASQHVSVYFANYYTVQAGDTAKAALSADLKNNIIYGYRNDEFTGDKKDDYAANVTVTNCLVKSADALPTWFTMTNSLVNQDPLFTESYNWDFTLTTESPAKGAGVYFSGILANDILGISRANPPSVGCYE